MAFLKKRTSFKKTSFIVRPEYKHQTYDVSTKGHTVFRIFPSPIEGKVGEFDPQIVPVDEEPLSGLSNSFAELEIVGWFGKDKLSFVTTCSDVNGEENLSPAALFYNMIDDFVKSETNKAKVGDEVNKALYVWSPWFAKKGIASRPQSRMLLQGILIEHGGEPCKNKDGKIEVRVPVVLCLNKSATIDMEDKLVTKLEAAEDISAVNSKMGDITSLSGGHAIRVSSYRTPENQIRYSVEKNYSLDNAGKPVINPPVTLDPSMVLSHFVPWENLLNIRDAKWQVDKIIEQFGPEAADYALGDDPVYGPMLPPSVAGSFERVFGNGGKQQVIQSQVIQQQVVQQTKPVAQVSTPPDETPAGFVEAEIVNDADEIPHLGSPAAEPAQVADATNSAVAMAMAAAKNNQSK